MNIYFDFEATQFSNKIIAIGATCEYGDFWCLVSTHGKRINSFITQLTGITKEMVKDAPSVEEAFTDLREWISKMWECAEEPVFYHAYGDSDKDFLHSTSWNVENKEIANFMDDLADSLIDDSKKVTRFFHTKAIGVYKALRYFEPDLGEQDHDPLNDAIALYRLNRHIDNAEPLMEYPFVDNDKIVKVAAPQPSKSGYLITAVSLTDAVMKPRFFNTYGEACDWLFGRIKKKSPDAVRDNILKRMKKAVDANEDYGGFHWTKDVC